MSSGENKAKPVKVEIFANVKQILGKEGMILHLDPSKTYTIKDILLEISLLANKDISILLVESEGKARGAVRIIVNGDEIHFLNGMETEIHDGDRISIFPLLGGG